MLGLREGRGWEVWGHKAGGESAVSENGVA